MTGSLAGLLNPQHIAIVGASESPGNRGGQAIRYLRKFGFAGTVTPVHPSGNTVHGYPGVTGLADLPHTPDVALVAVGARSVESVVADLGEHGIGAAIVWAGGFAEGGAEGAARQRALTETARLGGVRVLGPNCLGLVNTTIGFCGTFASWLNTADELLPGHISMVTQSGGLGAFAHAGAQELGHGFRFMASTGNEADISAVELLELFADDPETHVICTYLEGVTAGRRLVAAFLKARANGKDVLVLKGGRSAASARAVAAHTGALAGQARVWDSILRGVGAIQVYSLEELIEVSTALVAGNAKPRLAGRRVAIMSYGGGSGVLATDLAGEAGLDVPPFSPGLRDALRPLVPEIASLRNPVDLTPEAFNQVAYRERFPDVLRQLEDTTEIDGLLLQGGAMSVGAPEAARAMSEFHRTSAKQLAIYWPAAPEPAREVFRRHGVRVFDNQPAAVATLSTVIAARQLDQPVLSGGCAVDVPAVPVPDVVPGQVLGEHAVHDILRAAGVPTMPGRLASSAADAVRIAASLGGPVAMKVVSPQVTHRAAAGLVRLKVVDDVGARFEELVTAAAAGAAAGDVTVEGVYVQRMAESGGHEFLASAFHDESFGPVVSVGAGGVQTELVDDIVFAPAPLSLDDAVLLVGRLRTAGYLERKGQGECLAPLAGFMQRLSVLAAGLPWPGYVLEVNPVLAGPSGAVALDGLIVIEKESR